MQNKNKPFELRNALVVFETDSKKLLIEEDDDEQFALWYLPINLSEFPELKQGVRGNFVLQIIENQNYGLIGIPVKIISFKKNNTK